MGFLLGQVSCTQVATCSIASRICGGNAENNLGEEGIYVAYLDE
jgi:positive regulator of sigma E activity